MTAVTALVPDPQDAVDLSGDALRDWLAGRYSLPADRWVRLDLVTGVGGQTTGASGLSEDLTGGVDRVLLGVLRRSADVVLIGAGSVRAERPGLPATARLAIATRGGLRPDQVPDPVDGRRAIVLCPAAEAARLGREFGGRARVVAVPGDPDTRPGRLVEALEGVGLRRIVCEGGGVLASRLLAARAVDEFDQTIAPLLVSPGVPLLSGRVPATGAALIGLLRDETDRLYLRWRLTRG